MDVELRVVLTDEEMDHLKHMLGVRTNVRKQDWGFRNYFCANAGSKEEQEFLDLAKRGFVIKGRSQPKNYFNESKVFFHATELGCIAAGLNKSQTKRALRQ